MSFNNPILIINEEVQMSFYLNSLQNLQKSPKSFGQKLILKYFAIFTITLYDQVSAILFANSLLNLHVESVFTPRDLSLFTSCLHHVICLLAH